MKDIHNLVRPFTTPEGHSSYGTFSIAPLEGPPPPATAQHLKVTAHMEPFELHRCKPHYHHNSTSDGHS